MSPAGSLVRSTRGASALAPKPVPWTLLVLLCGIPCAVQAQDQLSRAFDLERRGSYPQAVEIYQSVLQNRPGELAALLGLERSLTPLNRLAEIVPAVAAAIKASPGTVAIYAVGLRAYAASGQFDSLPHLVELWSRVAPGDESPYREWAGVALQRHDRATARRAYLLARERLGKPEALAAEMAQLASVEQDWPTAVREWVRAVHQLPGYRSAATSTLAVADSPDRPALLQALEKEGSPDALRMAIDLRARWGDPVGAYDALTRTLPAQVPAQIEVLQTFLELARIESTPPYQMAQARTLEALGERWVNPQQRARYRLDAARAYSAAGDQASARRMLGRVADDAANAPAIAAGATVTLIDLLLREGKADEASTQLEQYRGTLAVDEYLRLRRGVALRWAQNGALDKAERYLAPDSSVEATAVLGRMRLYAGDLKGASDLWKEAGPFTGTREEATARATLLALLQPITEDTLAPLGAAFQLLDRGDTLGAAHGIEAVAGPLPLDAGGGELRVFAGRLYASATRPAEAERLYRSAVGQVAPGAAAAALLELGRLYLGQGRRPEAIAVLEQLILEYPASALVPQGRRLLDQARNAVPQT